MMNKNFTFQELTKSSGHPDLAAKSIPVDVAENLFNLWFYILQPLRDAYGKPIIVTSGYRPTALNKAVGGVANSQHLTGQAVDIRAYPHPLPKGKGDSDANSETKKLGKLIQDLNLPFDQLIYEGTWIHVSYGPRHRRQVLYK